MYKVHVHIDESEEKAYLDGESSWEDALKRKRELLRSSPSVALDGTRHWNEITHA